MKVKLHFLIPDNSDPRGFSEDEMILTGSLEEIIIQAEQEKVKRGSIDEWSEDLEE